MCGIGGFFDPSVAAESAEQTLARMGECLARRGPDGAGSWFDPVCGVGLAHRRLSILDLSDCGRQPMACAHGRWVITFNGEIYNHAPLRETLSALGHEFRGHSDTEVLVAAISQWGVSTALDRVFGMFAFAALDRRERQLWLARDRAGEKPLYYALQGGRLIFASTLAALEAHPRFRARVSRDAVGALVQRGFVPAPLSIYEDTCKLRPAHVLRCDLSGARPVLHEHRYWSLPPSADREGVQSEGALLDRLHDTLAAVVAEQRIADRPLGAFLSGGVDSSLVTALMQTASDRPVKTFTIGFHEEGFDEAAHARRIAAHLGTEHTEVYLDATAGLQYIESLADVYDEPFADPSQLPTLLVSEITRRDVVVALSGDGGDESFAGYDRYLQTLARWQRLRRWPRPLRAWAGRGLQAAGRDGVDRWLPQLLSAAGVRDARRSAASALRFWGEHLATPALAELYGRTVSSWYHGEHAVPGARLQKSMHGFCAPPQDAAFAGNGLRALMYWDFVSYLPDDILVKVDRASMYYGLEVRAPMLDARVLEVAWKLPEKLLTADGRAKYPLRRLLARHVPERLFDRPKQGFAVPLDRWLRGPLLDWAENLLGAERLLATGLFEPGIIRQRWEQHRRGVWDNATTLWPILMFMSWWLHRGCPAAGTEPAAVTERGDTLERTLA